MIKGMILQGAANLVVRIAITMEVFFNIQQPRNALTFHHLRSAVQGGCE